MIEEPAVQPTEQPDQGGLYFYGVVRARRRGLERRHRELTRIRYRDLEALVRGTSFELPQGDDDDVKQHQKVIESVMRRSTILPAPFGIVFKDRRAVIKLLQDQYLVLDEGLSLLEGHWELRLHVSAKGSDEDHVDLSDQAMSVYAELRRFARAAVPFPHDQERLMSAAFLVERTSWVEFIEHIDTYGEQHKTLSFDVTGPWPAYDFVRIAT